MSHEQKEKVERMNRLVKCREITVTCVSAAFTTVTLPKGTALDEPPPTLLTRHSSIGDVSSGVITLTKPWINGMSERVALVLGCASEKGWLGMNRTDLLKTWNENELTEI